MTIVYGTGFEMGSADIIDAADTNHPASLAADSVAKLTGIYSLKVEQGTTENWVRFAFSATVSEAWFSVQYAKRGSGKHIRIEFELSDGGTVGFRAAAGTTILDAYRGNTKIDDGVTSIAGGDGWFLLEGHVVVADSGGELDLSIDGAVEFNLSADTKPGSATTISFMRFYLSDTSSGDEFNIDDLTMSESAAPGDLRYLSKVPDSDDTATWTRSAGADNYALVDEIPPSDADYVETSTNTNQDLYTLTDYALNNAINHIVQWIRGLSTPSGGEFKMQIKSGATTSEESTSGLATSAEYVSRILEEDPNTLAAWGKTAFNAALAGQEAVVSSETVRVTQHIIELAYNQNVSIGLRPLEMDVDLETGSRVWVTSWEDGSLFLKRLPSTLVTSTSFSFGAATENEVDIRTFYLSPYAPGFFGTANLNDIIYVFGRWDDGAVTHIEKSTDGGATFTDIGDSATWGAGWVGGFFADDANILYAFVNGGSRALYRSIDAGATWTNLSALPFDVDPGGVSKHPDGRILISNRDAGAQTAAYAESPDYSSWIDATGSPSFPASTPGNGSNAIIWVT